MTRQNKVKGVTKVTSFKSKTAICARLQKGFRAFPSCESSKWLNDTAEEKGYKVKGKIAVLVVRQMGFQAFRFETKQHIQKVIGKRKLFSPSASLIMATLVPTTSSRSSSATAIRRAVIR